jgi:hypothetical protein
MNETPKYILILTAVEKQRKDGITSGLYGSYGMGHTCTTMNPTIHSKEVIL